MSTKFDQLLNERTAKEADDLFGLVVAAVDADGKVCLWQSLSRLALLKSRKTFV